MKALTLAGLIAALMAVGISGCTPQAREQYSEAGQSAQMATEKTGEAIATDAKAGAEVAKDAAEESKEAIDNSAVTGQVRVALSSAHDLKIDDLNVDTVDNTVKLMGTVNSDEAKKRAGMLAEGIVGKDMKVDNQLQVVR